MFGGNDLLARKGGEQGSGTGRDRLTVRRVSHLGAGVLDQLPKPLSVHREKECHLTGPEPARARPARLSAPPRASKGAWPRPRPKVQESLSQISHGLDGRYGTMASIPDTQQDADLRFWISEQWLDRFLDLRIR